MVKVKKSTSSKKKTARPKRAVKKSKKVEPLESIIPSEVLEPEFSTDAESAASTALAPADPLARYLQELRKYPLLTKDEEYKLAVKYRETGDPQAAEILVTSNLRFVVKVAAEYARFGAKLIDLVQEGNVGLMHAVKEFNPYKGVRLITYAVWWIRGYIQEYLMRQYSMVRIGTTANQRKLFYQLQKQKEELDRLGPDQAVAQLSGRLGIDPDEVESMQQRLSGRDVSLDKPIGENQDSTLLDLQTSDGDEAVDDRLGLLEELEHLRSHIENLRPRLSEREKVILDERLLADEPLTLQEIGEKYQITREAVRQIEQRLMEKLKAEVLSSNN